MKKLSLLCFLFASTHTFAQTAATVLFTTNKVTVEGPSGNHSIARGASLAVGDAVITGDSGLANLKYLNGTLINVGNDSNYRILEYSPNKADIQIRSELSNGQIHTKTNGKIKEAVKTPVVALAVLGTEFELAVRCVKKESAARRDKCKSVVNLHVIEGSVQAGGTTITAGSSVVINSPSSIRPAAFPPAAQVNPPAGSAGNISSPSSSAEAPPPSTIAASSVTLTTVQTSSTTTSGSASATVVPYVPPPIPPFAPPMIPSPGGVP